MFINPRASAVLAATPPNSVPIESVTLTKFQTFVGLSFWGVLLIGAIAIEVSKHL